MSLLFGKKKKKSKSTKAAEPKPTRKLLWSKTYTQSSSFKGYRKIMLSRYYSDSVDATISKLKKKKYDLAGSKIKLENIKSLDKYNNYQVVNVYINGMLIGSVFNSDKQGYEKLTKNKIDKVHLLIEDSAPDFESPYVVTAKAYLLVHFADDDPLTIDVSVE